jgi:hypothetical protein
MFALMLQRVCGRRARGWHSAVYGCMLQLSCVLLLFHVCAAYICMSSQWPNTDISSFLFHICIA